MSKKIVDVSSSLKEVCTNIISKTGETSETEKSSSLESIYDIIYRSKYGEENELYISNPVIGKASCWNPLGDKLSANEKCCPQIINPEKYFTIRLDGKNFSTVIPKLKQMQIFEMGYSVHFENIMKTIANKVATHFSRVLYVFTQSDEITILFNKVENIEGRSEQFHEFSGRKDKLMTLASSYVTQIFNKELFKLCVSFVFDKSTNFAELTELIENLPTIIFDARVGIYDTLSDAFELILWRAYDCSVNGISQAVYLNTFDTVTKKEQQKMNTTEKLKLLETCGLLPLSDHQAYGTLLKKSTTMVEITDKKTGITNVVEKRCYVLISGPVIKNIKDNKFPEIVQFTNVATPVAVSI